MKFLYHLFFAAFIATIMFAGSVASSIPDLAIAVNTTSNTTNSSFTRLPGSYSYHEIMNSPEPAVPYPNLSAPIAVTAGEGDGPRYNADIRMSGYSTRQHVGQLSGQRIWQAIHNCLMDICPYERGGIGCYDKMPGAGTPGRGYKYASECTINEVPYRNGKGGYGHNAWITIKAQAIFRNKKYPGLGAATYEMAAGVYKAVTENKANCYDVDFESSRAYQFCNVPKHVLVAFPSTGPATDAWLSMTVEFNGKTDQGTLDCTGSKWGVTDFWEGAVRPDVARILGYPDNEWVPRTSCENDEWCFDVNTWRNCNWGVDDRGGKQWGKGWNGKEPWA